MSNSNSGYLSDSFEGISSAFTEFETLHEGKSCVVSRAKRYGRWWTLKSLNASVSDQELYRQRQRKEFEILVDLQHPLIVSVTGLEEVEGLGTCIVMEYVDGQTLSDWLRTDPSESRRKRVARKITEAVRYIHSKGVAHRDLKPSNILVSYNGDNVKIIDFGLADTDSHAVMKNPAGSADYMSPEQAAVPKADVRNDIYSLGILFREMNLGYGGVVSKCTGNIERRYRDVDSLMAAMERREYLRKRIFIGAGTVLVIFVVVAGMSIAGLFSPGVNRANVETARIDTLRIINEPPSEEEIGEKVGKKSQPMDFSVAKETPVVKVQDVDVNSKKETREKEALEKGVKMVDKMFAEASYPRHLDTLTSLLYYNPKLGQNTISLEMHNAVNRYVEGLGDSFDPDEKRRINDDLQNYCLQKITPVDEKLIKLLKQKDEIDAMFSN